MTARITQPFYIFSEEQIDAAIKRVKIEIPDIWERAVRKQAQVLGLDTITEEEERTMHIVRGEISDLLDAMPYDFGCDQYTLKRKGILFHETVRALREEAKIRHGKPPPTRPIRSFSDSEKETIATFVATEHPDIWEAIVHDAAKGLKLLGDDVPWSSRTILNDEYTDLVLRSGVDLGDDEWREERRDYLVEILQDKMRAEAIQRFGHGK